MNDHCSSRCASTIRPLWRKQVPRVAQTLKIEGGGILDPVLVKETIEDLKSVYKDAGHSGAQVIFSILPRPDNTAVGTFKVVETPGTAEEQGR